MVAILVAELGVLDLIAVGVLLLQTAHVFLLGTVELRGSEAILLDALGLTIDGGQGLEVLALLGHTSQLEGFLGFREQVFAIAGAGIYEGAVGFLGGLLGTHVEHQRNQVDAIVLNEVVDAYFLLGLGGVVLHENQNLAILHLLVLLDGIDGLGIVGHGLINHLGGVGINLAVFPEVLDDLLTVVHINITHDDDGLVVGTIPFVVVVAQHLRVTAVDDAHQTDGQTLAVFRTGIQTGKKFLDDALCGTFAQLPLLMDDATLLLNLLALQRQTVRPVFQHEYARVECSHTLGGHVADAIHRLVDRGVGIQVATEVNTNATGEVEQCRVGEMLRTVEGHVLQEVGQSTLVFVLLDRAHALGDVEVGHVLGPVVLADVVGQTIVQLTDFHVLVDGDGRHLHLLCHHCGHAANEQGGQHHKSLEFHC